jgi:hypothetical protein
MSAASDLAAAALFEPGGSGVASAAGATAS